MLHSSILYFLYHVFQSHVQPVCVAAYAVACGSWTESRELSMVYFVLWFYFID